jgi:hypothetical protein
LLLVLLLLFGEGRLSGLSKYQMGGYQVSQNIKWAGDTVVIIMRGRVTQL